MTASADDDHRTPIDRLFDPRTVAIVGIKEKIQYGTVLDNMLNYGFDRANLSLVNPFHPEVRGMHCEASVPEGTDAAFLLLRASLVPDVLTELVDRGVGAAIVVASGFAERGAEGRALQERVVAVTDRIAICGPNTMGVGNLQSGAVMWGAELPDDLEAGSVAAVFQSGGMTNLFLQLAAVRGIGVGKFVVAGNEAGTTVADYLDYLAGDIHTNTVALYFESAQDGRHLREALASVFAAGKRVIALVAGRSERSKATVATHTGNVAAGDRWARVLEGFGVAVVSTFDELVELTLLCSRTRPLASPKVQLLTVSGGESTWMTDLAVEVGIDLPAITPRLRSRLEEILGRSNFVGNPMDIGGLLRGAKPQQFEDVVRACAEECDAEVVGLRLNLPRDYDEASARAYRIAAAAVAAANRTCVFLTRASEPVSSQWRALFDELGTPLLQEVRRALSAISTRSRVEATEPPPLRPRPLAAELRAGTYLLGDLRPLLESHAIPTVFERVVATEDELRRVFDDRGGPMVLKLNSPELLHKTEARALRLGLRTPDEALVVFGELTELAGRLGLSNFAIAVQEQITDAVELLVGGSHDAEQGPVVVLGHGGVLAELFPNSAVLPGPVTERATRDALGRLDGAALFGPYRGQLSCDLDETAAVVARFSEFLASDAPEGSEWDLNPLMIRRGAVGPGSVVVVDALGVVK